MWGYRWLVFRILLGAVRGDLYSGTSDKGPSEIGMTSLQRTLASTHANNYIQWVPVNVIPAVHPKNMIICGIFYDAGVYTVYIVN